MNRDDIVKTDWRPLGYGKQKHGLWRVFDLSGDPVNPSAVGPHYATKKDLLADLERYAEEFGAIWVGEKPLHKVIWLCVQLGAGTWFTLSRHGTELACMDAYRRAHNRNPHINHLWLKESEITTHARLQHRDNLDARPGYPDKKK